MSRIKKTSNQSYIKVPSDMDRKVNNVLNRYFKSVDSSEDLLHIEGIIREVTRRVKQEVNSELSGERLALTITNIIEEVLPQEITKIKASIAKDVLDYVKEESAVEVYEILIDTTGTMHELPIPNLTIEDQVIVTVNGMFQAEDKCYTLTTSGDKITHIDFLGEIIEKDVDNLTLIVFKNSAGVV